MKNWYTRQEVADLLGVSKATVYHYAKQKKITKIEDPHRLIREARYEIEEVDALAEERKRNEPTGLRPSELAKQLGVPTQRIYALIQETDLPIEELPLGDERTIYSISEEAAAWIDKKLIEQRQFVGRERNSMIRQMMSHFINSSKQKMGNPCVCSVMITKNGDFIYNQVFGFHLQLRSKCIIIRLLTRFIKKRWRLGAILIFHCRKNCPLPMHF